MAADRQRWQEEREHPARAWLAAVVDAGVPAGCCRQAAADVREVCAWGGAPPWVGALWGAVSSGVSEAECGWLFAVAAAGTRAWLDGWSCAAWDAACAAAWEGAPPSPRAWPGPVPRDLYGVRAPLAAALVDGGGEAWTAAEVAHARATWVGWAPPRIPRPAVAEDVDVAQSDREAARADVRRWVARNRRAVEVCGAADGGRGRWVALRRRAVPVGAPSSVLVRPWACRSRMCLACRRAALARAVWRYLPFFAAPLRAGWLLELCTVTMPAPVAPVDDPAGARLAVGRWRRGLGRFLREMRRGVESLGIPAGAWQGGLLVVEVTPGAGGAGLAHVHAHLIVVRRPWYPYGESVAGRVGAVGAHRPGAPAWGDEVALSESGGVWRVAATRTGRRTPAACCRAWGWPLDDAHMRRAGAALGVRELLRRCGLGEVSDHRTLERGSDAASRIGAYLAKAAAYLAKAEGEGAAWWADRPDLHALLAGTRSVDPFGCVRGLHAAPDAVWAEVDGEVDPRAWLGWWSPDDDDAPAEPDGGMPVRLPGEVGHQLHAVSGACLDGWAEWCDVAELRGWLARFAPTT